ncbi:MAG: tetratricopeptide repeat protein, partial [Trichodesmium sp. MAG_R04]|nr:tetratricopeptide repeat protein [Trichodesmium sp. MAG_R04]
MRDLKHLISWSADEQGFLIKNKESLNQLLTFIAFVQGFTLGIIEVDFQGDLDGILKRVTIDEQYGDKVQFWLLRLDDPELVFFRDEMLKRLADFTVEAEKKLVIIIQGLENAIGLQNEKSAFLSDLNYVRDLLPRDIPYPIIFCLPTYAVNRLAKLAPDLWSWIPSVIKFNSLEVPGIVRENKFIVPDKVEERIPRGIEDRIDYLRERLSEYFESQDDSVKELFYLFSELGIAYRQQQDLEKAETYLHQAEDLYQQNKSLISTTDQGNLYYNLGYLYKIKNKGSIANNLEQAISYYQLALEVYTFEAFPVYWAATQYNLGIAYSDRIRGDKAQNIEAAIAAYQQALLVRTQTDFPMDWATTQYNLGNAYFYRIRGDKAQNIEAAIAAYQQALLVYTQTDFPMDWAMTQNNLGAAYSDRIRGDK